jgi:hypothetical protein
MKGVIFNVFNELVETQWDLEMWDDLLHETQPSSEGLYTSAGTYEDKELINMVVLLSQKTGISVPDLIYSFGEYLLKKLSVLYPSFFEGKSARDFLMSVDKYIHVEVKKLYPLAELPKIEYETPNENDLIMHYSSKRGLHKLAEGMIQGTSKFYGIKIKTDVQPNLGVNSDTWTFKLSFG